MEQRRFFVQLGLLSLSVGLILLGQTFIPALYPHRYFGWGLWAFFIGFTILTFFVARRAAHSSNLNTFSSVVLGAISGKMFCTIVIFLLYSKMVETKTVVVIVPFLVIYLAYTAFELYFLTKLGKIKR